MPLKSADDKRYGALGADMTTADMYGAQHARFLKTIFDSADKNGNGYLDPQELEAVLVQMGGNNLRLTDLDRDGDNRVSFEEFTAVLHLIEERAHPIFKKAGSVSAEAKRTGSAVFKQAPRSGPMRQGYDPSAPLLNPDVVHIAHSAWRKLAMIADKDGNNKLDEAELEAAFNRFDVDKSGYLNELEIRRAIKELAPQITATETMLMVAVADKSQDGTIDIGEFKMILSEKYQEFMSETSTGNVPKTKHAVDAPRRAGMGDFAGMQNPLRFA